MTSLNERSCGAERCGHATVLSRRSTLWGATGAVIAAGGASPALAHASDWRPHPRSALRVDGKRLVNRRGETVRLRGINLGGWLVTEAWMNGYTDSKDTKEQSGPLGHAGRSTLQNLEQRFGIAEAERLMLAWRLNWLTVHDLDQIAAWGFNMVRLPFSWRTFKKADESWIIDSAGRVDFSVLDWLIEQAARRGMYTIPVLHVWPDQRYDYEKIGRPEGRAILESMAELWRLIADRYRGDGAIAGFDIINEFPGAWGVQDALAAAIREADPNRVLIVEGFTLDEFTQKRAAGAFENSVFSEHLYQSHPMTETEIQDAAARYAGRDFPIYVGEFKAADFVKSVATFEAAEVSWSPWTYKTVDMGDWGAINYHSELRVDIQSDDYDVLMTRWSRDLTAWTRPDAVRNVWFNDRRVPAERYNSLEPLR